MNDSRDRDMIVNMSNRYAHLVQALLDCPDCKFQDKDRVWPCKKHWKMLIEEVPKEFLAKALGIPKEAIDQIEWRPQK